MKKDTPCKWKSKGGVEILISDKIDFKEYYKREEHYIIIQDNI